MNLLRARIVFVALIISSLYDMLMGRPIPDGHFPPPFPIHFPKYEFGYAVHDGLTGDFKSQHEVRHGDNVAGHYSVLDADGRKRIVEYRADDETGFNAIVHREGQIPSHHGNHGLHPVHGHHFQGAPIVAGPGPIGAGHPPPPHHHEPLHHDHHHDEHHVAPNAGHIAPPHHGHPPPPPPHHSHPPPPPPHHGHPPPPPPPPQPQAFVNYHAVPLAHSHAFQNNYFQPHP